MIEVKHALISVYEKEGIVELAVALAEKGVEILCTKGTKNVLDKANIPCRGIEEITGFSNLLHGRVKTLHPAIFAAVLSRREEDDIAQLSSFNISPIQMVVVNLYPFKEMVEKGAEHQVIIENIDIGGVSLLRAAAKNYKNCTPLFSPSQYPLIINELRKKGGISEELSFLLAYQAFSYTASYECAIDNYFREKVGVEFPTFLNISYKKERDLRYGENPHQRACIYKEEEEGFFCTEKIHGKELSFNNILDIDAALSLLSEFQEATAVLIKHTNPCGVARAENLLDAYRMALSSDPVSAFGAVLGLNREVDEETAKDILKIFTEVVIAPSFSRSAFSLLCRKKDMRLLLYKEKKGANLQKRAISGGILLQDKDSETFQRLEVVTKKKPTPDMLSAMEFGYKVVKHAKSNAIVVCSKDATFGIGAGCTSRIDAALHALGKAKERAKGAILASDAFFPFPDVVKVASDAGISAIIQPGGSIRDEEVIKEADERGICMVFTGMRHFLH